MNKCKMISEEIYGDSVSNVVHIKRIYAVPWYKSKERVVEYFSKIGRYGITVNGVFKDYHFLGWADAKCKTIGMLITIVPNNGQIKYN